MNRGDRVTPWRAGGVLQRIWDLTVEAYCAVVYGTQVRDEVWRPRPLLGISGSGG